MTTRVTQQIVTVVYTPSAPVRVTAFAAEIIRSNALPPVAKQSTIFIIAS